jgi:hypothetical protein
MRLASVVARLKEQLVGPDDGVCPGCDDGRKLPLAFFEFETSEAEMAAAIPRCDACGKTAGDYGRIEAVAFNLRRRVPGES